MKASTGSPPSSCRNPQRSAWRRRGRMSNDNFCMSNRLNFGLRTSAVALFPRQATTGGASSRIRSCHPRAVLFSPKASGIFQPSGKRRRSAALGRAGMGCSAQGAGQRHSLSGIFSQRNSQNANKREHFMPSGASAFRLSAWHSVSSLLPVSRSIPACPKSRAETPAKPREGKALLRGKGRAGGEQNQRCEQTDEMTEAADGKS